MIVTKKVFVILALIISLFLVATNIQAGWLFLIVSVLIGVLIVSYIFPLLILKDLEIIWTTPAEIFEDEVVPASLKITNSGKSSKFLFKVEDRLLSKSLTVFRLPPGETVKFDYEGNGLSRGFYAFGEVVLRSGAPFGLFYREKRKLHPANLIVYPTYSDIASFPLLESYSTPTEFLHERRGKGSGYDYLGTREYRPGDSMRLVHWRSSARTGELIVKEFEEEVASTVSIVLDLEKGGHIGEGRETTLEYAIRICASLAKYVLNSGHPLELVGHDGAESATLFQPNFWQVLEWLAKVRAEGNKSIEMVLEEISLSLKPRSTCIIITPVSNKGYESIFSLLQTRRIRVIAIFLDSLTFGAISPGKERFQQIIETLADKRIAVYRCGKGDVVSECLRRPSFSIKG